MENQTQTQQVPQIVGRLVRISALLGDIQKLAEEYNEAYLRTISLKVKGTNMREVLEVSCDNGYKVKFNTNTVYMYLETPKEGYRVFGDGEAPVGFIKDVPLECWDKLIAALEDLIRRKLNEIEFMRSLYYTYTRTA